jgi:predicted transcriptional regulator
MKSKEESSQAISTLAQLSKSIGHPTRLAILQSLASTGGWIEGKIIEVQGVAPTTVIQHLRELKRVGIIQGRIFGAQCKYGLNTDTLQEFKKIWDETMNAIINNSTKA